jgi:hypothetical protein
VKGCSAAGAFAGPRSATDLWCSQECTPPCQGGGRGFKSRQVRRRVPARLLAEGTRLPGRVAQLVERAPEKREVTGSTPVPTTGTPCCGSASTLVMVGRRGHPERWSLSSEPPLPPRRPG